MASRQQIEDAEKHRDTISEEMEKVLKKMGDPRTPGEIVDQLHKKGWELLDELGKAQKDLRDKLGNP